MEFSGIYNYENQIKGFNYQNVILNLTVGKIEDRLFCQIDSSNGMEGYIECEKIKILKVEEIDC